MNLLAFRLPDHIYYSDSCPAGLRGYSDQGNTWRFKLPDKLQFHASNNLLEFLAAIITPWINIINRHFPVRGSNRIWHYLHTYTTQYYGLRRNYNKNNPKQEKK